MKVMDMNAILEQVDALYEANKGPEAEKVMQAGIRQAIGEQNDACLLQLLNELMGYYRETSQVENSYQIAEQAISLAERMGLMDSIPYATTLLNAANAYRAGGRLKDSLELYLQVREVYDRTLSGDNMLIASFENNLSLLYQEMGEFGKAKEALLKALPIVEAKDADFEVAVTYTNLAGTCMQLGEEEEARDYALKAIEGFETMQVADTHYCAALSALGTYYHSKSKYVQAAEVFEKALAIMEQNPARTDYYYRLKERLAACRRAQEAEKQTVPEIAEETTGSADGETAQRMPEKERTVGQEVSEEAESGMEAAGNKEAQMEKKGVGLGLSRRYFEAFGRPMLERQFGDYTGKIAVGLAGEGSDCFGYDDKISADHDYGPDFCLWVTEETYEEIGEALEQAYAGLPEEFEGYQRTVSEHGKGRRGVVRISDFYKKFLQTDKWEEINWQQVEDSALAAAVNGEVFRDEEGIFTAMREKLKEGYPLQVRYLKIADAAARFSQSGQYNFARMYQRGDRLTAGLMLTDCIREAMKLQHYIEGTYPPHDKWLYRSMLESEGGRALSALLKKLFKAAGEEMQACGEELSAGGVQDVGKEQSDESKAAACMRETLYGQAASCRRTLSVMEEIAAFLIKELYEKSFISDTENYLDAHTKELVYKASIAGKSCEELAKEIAGLEFEAFDKVRNVGGRAECQNDWATFSIMRKSQYLTWNHTMLLQYLYDFSGEYYRGHNLIEEKYGRMMESTAPQEYEQMKKYFPALSEEKKAIIEQIVHMQVAWMEEFSAEYPSLADNARSVHSYDDNLYNTSYETYLRGEISTYSDKMLELYGRYVVDYARANKNLTYDIMTNSVHMYGYESLEAAEKFLGR